MSLNQWIIIGESQWLKSRWDFSSFFVRIVTIHTSVCKIISGDLTQSHPDKTVSVPYRQPFNYLQLSDCSFTEPPSNVTQAWIASLLWPCESTEVWRRQGDTQDQGAGQLNDCVPVSTWATSLSSDPPPQAPAQMEKCNQTECVWVAPGKLVVSVRLYLKVHLHIPPDDAETHPPGRRISQLFPAPIFRCWDRFSHSQRFQNSTI